MASYREEQKDEIEALESIYPDSFEGKWSLILSDYLYYHQLSFNSALLGSVTTDWVSMG